MPTSSQKPKKNRTYRKAHETKADAAREFWKTHQCVYRCTSCGSCLTSNGFPVNPATVTRYPCVKFSRWKDGEIDARRLVSCMRLGHKSTVYGYAPKGE